MELQYQYYPRDKKINENGMLKKTIECFIKNHGQISSNNKDLKSNEVLKVLSKDLESLGYRVERGKKSEEKIVVPVLYGRNNNPEKSFHADAINFSKKIVMEIEAGRALTNNQFLKDIFQACVMQDVDFLILGVRNFYRNQKDFEEIKKFLDTLYSSSRLDLPLKGILLVGY
ncbi:MAG: hypothetical protein OXU73_01110 [Candidatus Campbellbacteria bacterium]|nr:hypothetical protein [Candidatus Campbellbacteria bacterium]